MTVPGCAGCVQAGGRRRPPAWAGPQPHNQIARTAEEAIAEALRPRRPEPASEEQLMGLLCALIEQPAHALALAEILRRAWHGR
jgi:hypothetical protein